MVCNNCQVKPVFTLISGVNLCKRCFIKYFEKKVFKTIRQYKLISNNDKIAVALSGGKDSTVLLEILRKLQSRTNKFKLVAILIDEGISKYRPVTIRAAKNYCKKNGIKLYVYKFKDQFGYSLDSMVKKIKLNPCSICGVLRRQLLNKAARKLKVTKIATGHNCDDEAQSIVMNIFRHNNPALTRLGVITGVKEYKKFVPRIKPLYFMLEKEVMVYAYLKQLLDKFVECKYAQTSYRSNVRDMLNNFESKYPGTKHSILASFLDMLPALKSQYLKSNQSINYCKMCHEPAANKLCKTCILLKKLKH